MTAEKIIFMTFFNAGILSFTVQILFMCSGWTSNLQPFGLQDDAQASERYWPGLYEILDMREL